MTLIDALQLIVSIALAVVTVRQAYVTNKLEQRLYRLNTNLDQSIQRLHRAREAVIQQHKAEVFLRKYVGALKERDAEKADIYFEKHAELAAYSAELRGIALAIGDPELLSIVNRPSPPKELLGDSEFMDNLKWTQSEHLHTRISQLLLEATSDSPNHRLPMG